MGKVAVAVAFGAFGAVNLGVFAVTYYTHYCARRQRWSIGAGAHVGAWLGLASAAVAGVSAGRRLRDRTGGRAGMLVAVLSMANVAARGMLR